MPRWVAEQVIRIWLLRQDLFCGVQNDESAFWSPFVCSGSALLCALPCKFTIPWSPLSSNSEQRPYKCLWTYPTGRKEAARLNSFHWFLFAEWFCSLPFHTVSSLGHKQALICSVCQFPRCKYFPQGWLLATNELSQNMELGRDIPNQFSHDVGMCFAISLLLKGYYSTIIEQSL